MTGTAAIIIPARYASTRYPGKPLAKLRGATGASKSLIERSWDTAKSVKGNVQSFVATDDDRIAEAATAFGAQVLMTSPDCANGTERCAEAAAGLNFSPDIVVNLQGDAPLTPPWFVESLIQTMQSNPDIQVATPVLRCDDHALQGFLDDRAAGRVGATTAVFDRTGRALYFSKEVIPYTGGALTKDGVCPVFHHVGVYAYRPDALKSYSGLEPGPLEQWEGLEQLRFMEHGHPVHCVEVDARGAKFWELNNPEDVPRIEAVLAEAGMP
ncbi:MAG: manno-octulosonate cytidylyltransferase [Pseudomonadota bacterium]